LLHRDTFQRPRAAQSPCREPGSLLRLLLSSYGFAAVAAVVAGSAGAGFVASLLLFWLGGAATVLVLALILAIVKANDARTSRESAVASARDRGTGSATPLVKRLTEIIVSVCSPPAELPGESSTLDLDIRTARDPSPLGPHSAPRGNSSVPVREVSRGLVGERSQKRSNAVQRRARSMGR